MIGSRRSTGRARSVVCFRPGAADCHRQRRWVRPTSAGQDGMTGNRRELPRSSVAGHGRAAPHRCFKDSLSGRAHPAARDQERSGRGQLLLGGGSLAIAQTKPASSALVCRGRPSGANVSRGAARMQARSTTTATWPRWRRGELVAELRPSARMPRRLDQKPAKMAGFAELADRSSPLAGYSSFLSSSLQCRDSLRDRLTVGRRSLEPEVGVRIPVPQT